MCQGIGRRERRQRQCRGDRLLGAARIAQGADQPVMRLIVRGVGGDGGAKRRDGLGRLARRQQVETLLRERFGGMSVGLGHGCY